jgi:hypothetical protein
MPRSSFWKSANRPIGSAYSAGTGITELVEKRRDAADPQHVKAARRLLGRVKIERRELPNALARQSEFAAARQLLGPSMTSTIPRISALPRET